MRLSLSLLLSGAFLAATKVAAGGYQGALERVLLYYAYQIDGLNSPDNRQLGYRCGRWANGECQNNVWTEFRCGAFDDPNKPNGKRCNFYELMTNLGETQGGGADNARRMMAEGVDVNTKTLPIEKSAVKFYMYTRENMPYIDDNGVQQKGRVGDYNSDVIPCSIEGYRIMRYGGTDYNEHLNSLGDIVRNTAAKKNDGNKWMWDEFESTLGQLRAARIGDNGRYVVDAYKNDPKLDNKYITTENPGTNPATKDEYKNLDWYDNHKGEWTDLNWAETEENMHKGGVKDASDRMSNFRNNYFSSQSARDHQAVMNDFQAMETKVKGCK